MRLYVKAIPYSSVVGGGLSFIDETGAVRFLAAVRGSTAGLPTKEENDFIVQEIIFRIGPYGIELIQDDLAESVDLMSGKPKDGVPVHAVGDPPANVSTDLAKAKGFTGAMCQTCQNFTMVRSGTCETCMSCGATSGGCS